MLCVRLDERIEQMCETFVDKYFWEDADMHVVWSGLPWIMAWPLLVNDYYFSLEDVYAALWYNMPLECLTQYQDYKDDVIYNGATDYNLKSFYHLIYKDASEDKSEKEKGWKYKIPEWINRTPRPPQPGYFTYYSDEPIITLCWSSTMKSWSIELSCADDTDDVTAERNDEDDGWEDEEARTRRFYKNPSCAGWGCKRTRGCCSAEWGQHSKLQQRGRRGLRWDNK